MMFKLVISLCFVALAFAFSPLRVSRAPRYLQCTVFASICSSSCVTDFCIVPHSPTHSLTYVTPTNYQYIIYLALFCVVL